MKDWLNKHGSLITFLVGLLIGAGLIYLINDWQMERSRRLGCFIYNDKIYEMKERIVP